MNFFFDRQIPIQIARMLDAYECEHTITHLDEDSRFTPETPDVEWIGAIGADEPSQSY